MAKLLKYRSIDEEWGLDIYPQEMDLILCAENFGYFCNKFIKINDYRKGAIPFKLYDLQNRFVKHWEDNRFAAIVKPRQCGFTTTVLIWFLWKCMFQRDQQCMMICKTDREAVDFGRGVVQFALNFFPEEFVPNMSKNNDHIKIFSDTGSTILFHTPEQACGKSANHLYIDEAAFIPKIDEFWIAVFPMLSAGGRCIVGSTPNGKDNWFYRIAHRANVSTFEPMRCNHLDVPKYNPQSPEYIPNWMEHSQSQLGMTGWRYEYLAEFF